MSIAKHNIDLNVMGQEIYSWGRIFLKASLKSSVFTSFLKINRDRG